MYKLIDGVMECNNTVLIKDTETGKGFKRKVFYSSLVGTYVVINKAKYVLHDNDYLTYYFL